MNPDFPNRFVIMGDREGRLIAWDTTRNRIITNAQFHHAPVLSVAYQPAGNGAFLSAGGDGELKIRLPEGKRFTVHAHDGPMFQAGYSASERHVYTVGADRTAKVWDTSQLGQQNPHPRAIMSGHLKYVLTADMSPDEKMLVTGGGNKALNLWVVTSGRLIGHMQGHTSDIESVQFSPNGRVVVSAGEDNSVKIWSVDNQQELAMLVFQKNGNQYAGVTFDNRAFGDRNSGLLSVYIDGKQASPSEAEHVVEYIGRGIVIMETDN
jgi:WD40 repeat protein